jgi:hypothetical protein
VGEREADRHQGPSGAVPDRVVAASAGHMGAVSARWPAQFILALAGE